MKLLHAWPRRRTGRPATGTSAQPRPAARVTLASILAVAATVAFGAVSSGPASALAPADVPSIGADAGRFTLDISCAIYVPDLFGTTKVIDLPATVDIKGLAPVQLRPGQRFYLSQGAGTLTLPDWIATLGGLATFQTADADLPRIMIGASGSTPASINLADLTPLSVTGIPLQVGKPVVVGLPKTGAFDIGPYTAPASGVTQLKFEGATANVVLHSSTGLDLNVRAECTASKGNALLSIAVGGTPGGPDINYSGEPLNFPAVPAGNLVGIVTTPYSCKIDGQRYDVGVAVGAVIPLAVQRFGSIKFSNASGALVLPKETVNKFLDQGITSIAGRVDEVRLNVQDGLPSNPNTLGSGVAVPKTALIRDQRLIIGLPATGTLTAGPFKPSLFASHMVIGMGNASASFTFNDTSAVHKATCPKPSTDALLVDAPVL